MAAQPEPPRALLLLLLFPAPLYRAGREKACLLACLLASRAEHDWVDISDALGAVRNEHRLPSHPSIHASIHSFIHSFTLPTTGKRLTSMWLWERVCRQRRHELWLAPAASDKHRCENCAHTLTHSLIQLGGDRTAPPLAHSSLVYSHCPQTCRCSAALLDCCARRWVGRGEFAAGRGGASPARACLRRRRSGPAMQAARARQAVPATLRRWRRSRWGQRERDG